MRSTTSGRRLIGAALAGFLVLLVAFAGWLVAQHNLGKADSIGSVVAMFAVLVGLPISLISLVGDGRPSPLAPSGEHLAEHLAEQFRRQLSGPGGGFAAATPTTATPTRWTAAAARLRTTVAAPPEPGRVPNFATAFRALAQRRFVVIGRAGFGKPYLAARRPGWVCCTSR